MSQEKSEIYMQRCLELASCGFGNTAPNPLVGCVIVHKDKIVGEGYHQSYGGPHAEVNAINSVKDKSLLKQSTLYVNLEPCAHFGKTPPCADLIINSKIPKLVIGCSDSYKEVAGRGIQKLTEAGCDVKTGILEVESREINKRFFTFHEQKRPYIVLKWAQSKDGFIDIIRKKDDPIRPNWITDEWSRSLVHKWRSEEASILVGTNTAVKDNPRLNVREWPGKNPVRLLVDRTCRLSETLYLFDGSIPTIVFTSKKRPGRKNLEYVSIDFNNNPLEQLLNVLWERGLQSVFIEGGRQLLTDFISKNLWDEARVFTGNKPFYRGIEAPAIQGIISSRNILTQSELISYKNEN